MSEHIKFGVSSVDITPPLPASLQGQFYERITTEVESPITANIFAVESGGQHFVICSCDLVGIDATLVKKVRESLTSRCPEITADNLILCATHTHSAPQCCYEVSELAIGARFLPEGKKFVPSVCNEDGAWTIEQNIEFISEKITDAICVAWESRRPGYFAPAFGRAVTGHCRRAVYKDGRALMYGLTNRDNFRRMESGNDTGVELLYLFDEDKNVAAALADIACPSQVLEHSRFISSDFWGKARRLLKKEFGENFVLIGMCSAAGCQSPRDLVREHLRPETTDIDKEYIENSRNDTAAMWSLAGAQELGRRVRNVVVESLPDRKRLKQQAEVACIKRTVQLPLRRVSEKDYELARESFLDKVAVAGKDIFIREDMQALHLDGGVMQRYMDQKNREFYPAEIVIARLDDMAFVSNPFELFLDYGCQLRAKSPAAQTFIIQLANGYSGYLPTKVAERGGHYSGYVASGMTGSRGGQMLVDKFLAELKKIFK